MCTVAVIYNMQLYTQTVTDVSPSNPYMFVSLQASNKKQSLSFYSIPEFTEWKEKQSNLKSWKIKYYKGLSLKTCGSPALNVSSQSLLHMSSAHAEVTGS